MRINHNNGIPLHLQVEKLLRELIEIPKYKDGELFPKEVDMANLMGISRNTVRQAISKLVMEGLLERKKGVGTKVAKQNIRTKLQSWMSFTQEMKGRGLTVVNYNIDVEKVIADAEVAQALEIAINTEVIKLSRLRGDNDGPFVLFVSWLHPRIGLSGTEDFTRPLYEIIENNHSIVADLSREEIKAICANKKVSELLGISDTDPVLNRIRCVYDPGKRPIEFCKVYYRADKFSYTIDIKKEIKYE
ncbi:MAG: GntR family transcriptional regulator [Bacteroidales bacterium]|jgi:GntR family transcriptional regulator|nr:GntR family transcriptional regulator [Bacteroidales bacterium]